MPRFDYPCPDCRTTNSLHERGCRFEGVEWARIEDAYVDVVASLATGVRSEAELEDRWSAREEGEGRWDREAREGPDGADAVPRGEGVGGSVGRDPDRSGAVGPGTGRAATTGRDGDDAPGPVALRRAALARLKREGRVADADGRLRLLTAEEFRDAVAEPTHEPMATLQRHGSVPGCHDNAVFAMIAWYEMVGLSWEETRERVVEWLVDTGAWDRGGFEEATPGELVDKKRHVYDSGYGWKEKASAAKRVIDRRRS